ncbi:MAG: recombination protein RecR [Myxococcales bacterium]|nr:recombination protein RecR [Myxococcales bacterium]MCB9521570.1 recombination protein RecR [Myxococcales bacterium]MCB9530566.1 recombination protein RecR [Myxococcales bacterium]MCB9534485.1 recombination protein RecR [Myxococcales bacterium]
MADADAITELVNQLTRLPGVGEKTATRLAFFLVEAPPDLSRALGEAILSAPGRIRRCRDCGTLTERDPCRICANPSRDGGTVCVVEATPDIAAVERTAEFGGVYHVLHGLIRPLDGVGPDDLNLASLLRRVSSGVVREVIVATNPSVEGEATAMYIRGLLGPQGVRVSRIASGLPVGGELEYADRATLGRAIAARVVL